MSLCLFLRCGSRWRSRWLKSPVSWSSTCRGSESWRSCTTSWRRPWRTRGRPSRTRRPCRNCRPGLFAPIRTNATVFLFQLFKEANTVITSSFHFCLMCVKMCSERNNKISPNCKKNQRIYSSLSFKSAPHRSESKTFSDE